MATTDDNSSLPSNEMTLNQNGNNADSFDQESYQATQNLILRLGRQQDELQEQIKQMRDMLSNIFENDESFTQAQVTANEATSLLKKRRGELNETEEVVTLKAKIKDANEDLKLVKESLNNHLINYFQLTGSTALDLPDGQEREFTLNAKLKRPKRSQ